MCRATVLVLIESSSVISWCLSPAGEEPEDLELARRELP